MDKIRNMKKLVQELNRASEIYYNTEDIIMTDQEFDTKIAELKALEEETGIILSTSPLHHVGAKVLTELAEVKHNHPMLSLDKCHSAGEVLAWSKCMTNIIAMTKADGLTVSIKYVDGNLVSAETRGNGEVGSDCTEHIKLFRNVPLHINIAGTYIIDGEAIIYKNDFDKINKNGKFKNPRNTASGSLSVLDTKLVKERRLSFLAWDVIEGGSSNSLITNLNEAQNLGFTIIPCWNFESYSKTVIECANLSAMKYSSEQGIPCDGVVWKFDDIAYAKSLGRTEHHFNGGIAWKPEKIEAETKLKDIEWTIGKTGVLTPVAVFNTVELEGTSVERASMHNLSLMTDLLGPEPYQGQLIKVYKANMIIPQLSWADNINKPFSDIQYIHIPRECPVCGGKTEIKTDNDTENLICSNPFCKGKTLGRLNHFVSKDCMNIDGLSEATLNFLIDKGWLTNYKDLYFLQNSPVKLRQWKASSGFGDKSVDKILTSIEKSKLTTLERVLDAISIPLIGTKASKDISKYVNGEPEKFVAIVEIDPYEFTSIDGIGDRMISEIIKWRQNTEEYNLFLDLLDILNIQVPEIKEVFESNISGKSFCITGSLLHFKNRKELVFYLENHGAKAVDSVSKNTDFLINNDKQSTSSKNKKAQSIGIPIISEDDLLLMIGE